MNWISESCWVHHSINDLCHILALNVQHHQKDPMNALFLNLGLVTDTSMSFAFKGIQHHWFFFLTLRSPFYSNLDHTEMQNCDAPNIQRISCTIILSISTDVGKWVLRGHITNYQHLSVCMMSSFLSGISFLSL